MPAPVFTPEDEREALTAWFRQRMEQVEREHAERIEILKNGGEHPSPVFARQVKMMGYLGIEKSIACKVLGIATYTLETHYVDEYEIGKTDAIMSVAANAMRIGSSTTDPAAAKVAMDILARRGGVEWKPPAQQVKMEDERSKPPANIIDSSTLTPEEREQLRAMIERRTNGAEAVGLGQLGHESEETAE
jgi:hypothetical protein